MLKKGELVRFISPFRAMFLQEPENPETQLKIWPETACISAGEIGVVLSISYFEEVGSLAEVLIGNTVFFDIPYEKVETLPTPAM